MTYRPQHPRGPLLLAVMGPTASGKTALAEALADWMGAVLINADAFQAYRGMDIGTAKPEDRGRYRMLDIKNPDQSYGVGEFCVRAAKKLLPQYEAGRHAIVVGGTGQYIRALFEEYGDLMPDPDPELRARFAARLQEEGLEVLAREFRERAPEIAAATDLRNPVRVTRALERLADSRATLKFSVPYTNRFKVAIVPEKKVLDERIAHRTRLMMHNGWVEEVRRLIAEGYGPGDPGFRAIGYRTIVRLLDGDLATEDAEREIVQETVAYAKRQRTWLRSEPRLQTLAPDASLDPHRVWETILAEAT